MKKRICFVLAVCVLLVCVTAYAGEMKKFEITYDVGESTSFKTEVVVSPTESTFARITKDIPVRENYVFLGWSMTTGEKDSLFRTGENVKISESTVFEAVWKYENSYELTYVDEGREILPKQIVVDGATEISEIIPHKPGKIFYGWKAEKLDETLKPGQALEVSNDTTLTAVWKPGNLLALELVVNSERDGRVTFAQNNMYSGPMAYDAYSVEVKNLATADVKIYDITSNSLMVEGLAAGQYQARLCAMKYGVKYMSPWENFVVFSGKVVPENSLKLIMDGEELLFSETPPMLLDGYTYIALRHFCESMNAKVDWNAEERSATISLGGDIVKVYENSDRFVVNGTVETLPSKTVLVSSRLMLPLRSVAELCRAEIVWDDDRTVYIFGRKTSFFDETMVYIQNNNGEYLGADSDGLIWKNEPGFECGWIFDVYDEEAEIYCIYSMADFSQKLRVEDAVIVEGQDVLLETETKYDGHLWKVVRTEGDRFVISPANAEQYYLDAEDCVLSSKKTTVTIKHISEF